MAFNAENDPLLEIDVNAWYPGFVSDRNDPSIHISEDEVLWSSIDEMRKEEAAKKSEDDDEYADADEPVNPWVEKKNKIYRRYVRVSKLAAKMARDAIFRNVDLAEVYRMISKRFAFEAAAVDAERKASCGMKKRRRNRKPSKDRKWV